MISNSMLDALQDDELRVVIEQSQGLLKKRDEDRKAKAIEQARATLAAAGLTLKDLSGKGRAKGSKGPTYRGGHTYQHPVNRALTWNAKGKKPTWLVDLEGDGKSAVEVA
jgi:DNA-binding protein H-NS